MEPMNPYQSPNADVSAIPSHTGFDESGPFSPKGRFGRLSYLAWGMLMAIPLWVASVILGLGAGMSGASNASALGPAFFIIEGLFLIPMFLFAIRRLHDFNASGWWSLFMIVPLANLVLGLMILFRRGNEGTNNYGPPRLTRGWEKVLGGIAIGFLILALIGIIAAIAIPAYVAAKHGIH